MKIRHYGRKWIIHVNGMAEIRTGNKINLPKQKNLQKQVQLKPCTKHMQNKIQLAEETLHYIGIAS